MDRIWSSGMYGVWGSDPRPPIRLAKPFEIDLQGLGVFACRKAAWPGFNPTLRGFGGEEGYIHEKFRRAGGRNAVPALSCAGFIGSGVPWGFPTRIPGKIGFGTT